MRRTTTIGILLWAVVAALPGRSLQAQLVQTPTFLVVSARNDSHHYILWPDVAVGNDGTIVFIWGGHDDTTDFATNGILSRPFSEQGVPLAPTTQVDASGLGWGPVLTSDPTGGFVSVWQHIETDRHLYTRRLDSLGAGVGSDFSVAPMDMSMSIGVAVLTGGNVVYIWFQSGLMGRVYDSGGQPLGEPFKIADNTYWYSYYDIKALPDGGFAVMWQDTNLTTPVWTWARTYGPVGQPRTDAFPVSGRFLGMRMAASDSGILAVAGYSVEHYGQQLWIRYVTVGGALLGDDVLVHEVARFDASDTSSQVTDADLGFDFNGNLYVVWTDLLLRPNPPTKYLTDLVWGLPAARMVDAAGKVMGPEVTISPCPGLGARTARLPDGKFVNLWLIDGSGWAFANVVSPCPFGNQACDPGTPPPVSQVEAVCRLWYPTPAAGTPMLTRTQTATATSTPRPTRTPVPTRTPTPSRTPVPTRTSTPTPVPVVCGDGIVGPGEECDDGNLIDGDGCDSNCTITRCGNGIVTGGEECDDGNRINGDGCDNNCTITSCGNGIVTAGEECDDGNYDDGDGCDSDCTVTRCGNGIVTGNEQCDDGNLDNGDGCDKHCLIEDCGDGRIEGDEQCDDGNYEDGDGCESDCTLTPHHDTVVLAVNPLNVVIRAGVDEVDLTLHIQVRNADITPKAEKPGHIVQLVGDDGECPWGTVADVPDFGTAADQDYGSDYSLVSGGATRTASVPLQIYRSDYDESDPRVAQRCTLTFTADAVLEDHENVDPTPQNNTIQVELNVYVYPNPEDMMVFNPMAAFSQAQVSPTPAPFFIVSAKPVSVTLPAHAAAVTKKADVKVTTGGAAGAAQPAQTITVVASDGDCPAGTVSVSDFNPRVGGAQNVVTLGPRKTAVGKLPLTIAAAGFTSRNAKSPARCTALITSTADGTSGPTNHVTKLLIEVTDHNDF